MDDEIPTEIAFRKLGLKASVSTFENRKKLQKIVYLSEELFGIRMGFESSFTWYLYGPYSPKLTRVMFREEEGSEIDYDQFDRLKAIVARDFFKKHGNSAEMLELLGSLYYVMKETEGTEKDPKAEFRDLKPQFADDAVDDAFDIIHTVKHTLQ